MKRYDWINYEELGPVDDGDWVDYEEATTIIQKAQATITELQQTIQEKDAEIARINKWATEVTSLNHASFNKLQEQLRKSNEAKIMLEESCDMWHQQAVERGDALAAIREKLVAAEATLEREVNYIPGSGYYSIGLLELRRMAEELKAGTPPL